MADVSSGFLFLVGSFHLLRILKHTQSLKWLSLYHSMFLYNWDTKKEGGLSRNSWAETTTLYYSIYTTNGIFVLLSQKQTNHQSLEDETLKFLSRKSIFRLVTRPKWAIRSVQTSCQFNNLNVGTKYFNFLNYVSRGKKWPSEAGIELDLNFHFIYILDGLLT
jgi:hypothetical protein